MIGEITKAQSDNVIVVLKEGQLTVQEMQKLPGRIFGPNAPGTPKNTVQIIYSTPEGLKLGELLERISD